MLKYLHIENIAVIENADIEFTAGFNVLTGETGAGKSIVIDSINAVLGERASKDLIRSGCNEAMVSAVFGELTEENIAFLKENDIEPDEDGNLLISRRLSLTGKGIIKINGKPFTATALRNIASSLINIHGQHDNQALLNPDRHYEFLDLVAENDTLKQDYYLEFKNLNKIRRELEALETDEDEKARKIELLKYQIEEINSANIKLGEETELKAKLKIAESYDETVKSLSYVYGALSGDDETDGAITLLNNSLKKMEKANIEALTGSFDKLNEALSLVNDLKSEISGYLDRLDIADLDIDNINTRLDYLQRLMLKYGGSEERMLEFLENAKTELENITFVDKKAAELGGLLNKSKEALIEKASVLTESRKKAAESFGKSVCGILEYLNMPRVKFLPQITQSRYTKNGCDEVEFLISANMGEDLKPLSKIASGGELSRIMLAIKSSLLEKDNVGTMIFDEIDTGISGYAADKVGEQLKKVSFGRQVICVTHLAQIASKADCHFVINKNNKEGRTFTEVLTLDYKERISEIARIMSGGELTENLYNSAKELLDRS